jgi:hypothetical protein
MVFPVRDTAKHVVGLKLAPLSLIFLVKLDRVLVELLLFRRHAKPQRKTIITGKNIDISFAS